MLASLVADLRLAWKGLTRARAFSAAAILTLALGIAATTAMFTLVRGVLLRPLPVRDQDRVIVAWKDLPGSGLSHHPFGDTEIEAVASASQLLEAVAGVDANGVGRETLSEEGDSTFVRSSLVAGDFFRVLGVSPSLGRTLTRGDDVEGAEDVVVISHGLWTRRFARSPDVIGRRVTFAERRFTIVGVMPPDLDFPSGTELWRTTHSVPTGGPFGDAARREIDLLARIRPGVTIEQAQRELAALTARFEEAAPAGATRGLVPVVRSLQDVVVGNVRSAMMALMAAVGLVLLIASANVANLLLMRGESRRAELAVRHALGAGHGRLVRQLIVESLTLTLVAAGLAFVATWWSLHTLLTLLPEGLPRIESIRVDGLVFGFTFAVAVVTTCMSSLVPALSFARADLASQLRAGGRGAIGSAARRGRRVLVMAQIALAVTVVSAAGLLSRTLLSLEAIDTGVAADRLLLMELSLPQRKYAERAPHAAFLDRAIAELQALPAIAAVTPVNTRPFVGDGGWDVPRFTAEGQSADLAARNPSLNLESIYPNYFATFEIPIVRGRPFADADREGTQGVAIVSADVAARLWPQDDPIGKRIKFGNPSSREAWLTIVGVAGATRYRDLAEPRPTLYLPAAQFLVTAQILVLRVSEGIDVVPAARDRIRSIDRDVLTLGVRPFRRLLDAPLARPRFNAWLSSLFACAALLLSSIGLYAVMAAHVRQRDREIALRIALGADPSSVRGLVLRETGWLAGSGASLGLAASVVVTRVVSGMLYGVDALDPTTLIGAALLLVAAAVLASYLPMRRASRVDAVAVLRN